MRAQIGANVAKFEVLLTTPSSTVSLDSLRKPLYTAVPSCETTFQSMSAHVRCLEHALLAPCRASAPATSSQNRTSCAHACNQCATPLPGRRDSPLRQSRRCNETVARLCAGRSHPHMRTAWQSVQQSGIVSTQRQRRVDAHADPNAKLSNESADALPGQDSAAQQQASAQSAEAAGSGQQNAPQEKQQSNNAGASASGNQQPSASKFHPLNLDGEAFGPRVRNAACNSSPACPMFMACSILSFPLFLSQKNQIQKSSPWGIGF